MWYTDAKKSFFFVCVKKRGSADLDNKVGGVSIDGREGALVVEVSRIVFHL